MSQSQQKQQTEESKISDMGFIGHRLLNIAFKKEESLKNMNREKEIKKNDQGEIKRTIREF